MLSVAEFLYTLNCMLPARVAPTPQRRHPEHQRLGHPAQRRAGTAAGAAAGAASASGDAGVKEKGRTQRIMEAMPSSQQAMGAGGSSTYQVQNECHASILYPSNTCMLSVSLVSSLPPARALPLSVSLCSHFQRLSCSRLICGRPI